MKTNTEKDEKICWACKRILVGGSKFGLCPDCFNKYGSTAATLGIGSIALLGRKVLKNGRKIAKSVIDVVKIIKS
jgi:hypothetical protein